MESHHRLGLQEHFLFHINAQGRLAITQGKNKLALMGLSSLIRDIRLRHILIEHGLLRLRKCHRHLDGK